MENFIFFQIVVSCFCLLIETSQIWQSTWHLQIGMLLKKHMIHGKVYPDEYSYEASYFCFIPFGARACIWISKMQC